MNEHSWLTLIVSALSDFVISAGGCLTTAMVATGSASLPGAATILFAVITGLVATARGMQKMLTPSPPPAALGSSPTIPVVDRHPGSGVEFLKTLDRHP